jgi:hypothetical protein
MQRKVFLGIQALGMIPTFEFMTAAVFEARLCPTWLNEIKKTKLYNYTSPAAGINFLLKSPKCGSLEFLYRSPS